MPRLDTGVPREIKADLNAKMHLFLKTLDEFNDLRRRLLELLDDAISSGRIQVRTPKEVQMLVQAYTQLAETEGKLATAIANLTKVLNEREALTIAFLSARAELEGAKPMPAVDMKALVPVVPEEESEDEGE